MRQRVEQSFAVVSTPDISPVMDHTPLTPAQIKREKVEARGLNNGVEGGRRGVQAASFPLVHPPSSQNDHEIVSLLTF